MKKIILLFIVAFLLLYINGLIINKILINENKVFRLITPAIIFFIPNYLYLKFRKLSNAHARNDIIIFIVCVIVWDLGVRIFVQNWHNSIGTLPWLVVEVASILFAYILYTKNLYKGIFALVSLALLIYFLNSYVTPKLLNYQANNSFSEVVDEPSPSNWNITLKDNPLPFANITDKYIMLDFWYAGCGYCYKRFPDFNQFYLEHKDNKRLEMYSVYIPYKGFNDSAAFSKLDEKGYVFPRAIGNDITASLFKVSSYPTVIILHNNRIVFRGLLDGAKKYIEEKLLN